MYAALLTLLMVGLYAGEALPSALPPIVDLAQITFSNDAERRTAAEQLQRLEAAIEMVKQKVHTMKAEDDKSTWQTFTWITERVEATVKTYELWHVDPNLTPDQILDQGLMRTYGYHPFKEPTPPWLQDWADFRRRARGKADALDLLVMTQRDLERLRDALAASLGITGYRQSP